VNIWITLSGYPHIHSLIATTALLDFYYTTNLKEGVRTAEWKYMRYIRDMEHEELYNLKDDPLEKNNLAGKNKYQKVLEKMRASCDSLIMVRK
jgi:hypothetical protein